MESSKKNPRGRLQELTGAYSQRRAAEVMRGIKESSDDLASEAVDLLRKRIAELEEENRQLRMEIQYYRNEYEQPGDAPEAEEESPGTSG